MSIFASPAKPKTRLGYHRILCPTAGVKVSPFGFGGISVGADEGWSTLFGKNEDPFALLDAYYDMGGNFIDTANSYQNETSEQLIGEWIEKRGIRDQIVLATKFSAPYRTGKREQDKIQVNFGGNSMKTMRVSFEASLKKLRTDYVDVFYVHWWEFGVSVEEVMRGLHSLVLAGKVLYLGVSNTPAWVVAKANTYARANGLTPFSVYQGRWNATYRDMEAEIIPMCEDQGMAIVPWAALGGGSLKTAEQRKQDDEAGITRKSRPLTETQVNVSNVMEKIAGTHKSTLQGVALAYLLSQSTYVFPIVGVQSVAQVKAMEDGLKIKLTKEDVAAIHEASKFEPLFPIPFIFNFRQDQPYNLSLTAANNEQFQMGAWMDAPPKQPPYEPRLQLESDS